MLHAAPQQRGLLCSCGGPIRIHLSGSGLLPRTALFSVTVDATAIAAIPMPGGHSRHAVTVFFSMTRSKSVINFVFSLSDSHQSRANHVHNHKFHPRFLEFFEHYLVFYFFVTKNTATLQIPQHIEVEQEARDELLALRGITAGKAAAWCCGSGHKIMVIYIYIYIYICIIQI